MGCWSGVVWGVTRRAWLGLCLCFAVSFHLSTLSSSSSSLLPQSSSSLSLPSSLSPAAPSPFVWCQQVATDEVDNSIPHLSNDPHSQSFNDNHPNYLHHHPHHHRHQTNDGGTRVRQLKLREWDRQALLKPVELVEQHNFLLQPTHAAQSSASSTPTINNNYANSNKQTTNTNNANINNKGGPAISVSPSKSWMDEAGDEMSHGASSVGAAVSKSVNEAADAILPTQPVDTTLADDQPTRLLIPFGYLTLLCILFVGFLLGSAFGIFFHFHWTKYYTESGRIMTTNSAREALIRDSRYQTLEQSGGGKYNFSQCKLM